MVLHHKPCRLGGRRPSLVEEIRRYYELKKDGIIILDESINVEDNRIVKLPLKKTANNLGLPRAFTSVAAGTILKYFSLHHEVESLFGKKLSEDIKNKNIEVKGMYE